MTDSDIFLVSHTKSCDKFTASESDLAARIAAAVAAQCIAVCQTLFSHPHTNKERLVNETSWNVIKEDDRRVSLL